MRDSPFILIGGLAGRPHPLRPLAHALGDSVHCRGLDLPGHDGRRPPPQDVRAAAARLLPAVLLAQPEGPYHLGGVDFGGIVAYELARLLRSLGQPVARLVLFDAPLAVPGQPPPAVDPVRAVRELARLRHLTCLWQGGCDCGVDHSQPLSAQGARIARALGATDPARHEERILSAVTAYTAALRAYAAYWPRPSDVPTVLVHPAQPSPDWGRPSQVATYDTACTGWEFVGLADFRHAALPASRLTLFAQPHLAAIAALVRVLLGPDRAARRRPPQPPRPPQPDATPGQGPRREPVTVV
ncbi:MAG: thioesterase [Frankia sp.]|nr:thioesterase [Frankia sp.]